MCSINKSFSLLLIVILTVSSLTVIFATIPLGLAQSGTNVSGIISSNTTWTQANSPYMLTGPVTVNAGVTLTIQAGVTVNFSYIQNENYSQYPQNENIQVNGNLKIQGSKSNKVILVSTQSYEKPYHGSININGDSTFENAIINSTDISTIGKCTIENTIINSNDIFSNNSITMTNDTANGVYFQIEGGSAKVSDDTLSGTGLVYSYASEGSSVTSHNSIVGGDIEVFGGSAVISDNDINGGGSGSGGAFGFSLGSATVIISDNIITRFGIYGSGGTYTIERNIIENDYIAIQMFAASPIIEKNTIINNSIGLNSISSNIPSIPIVTDNNIYNNSMNNIYLGALSNSNPNILPADLSTANSINAIHNWWGTTNIQAINQSMRDSKNDSLVGTVTFIPFLSAPNSQAFPNLNAPVPTLIASPIFSNTLIVAIAVLVIVIAVIFLMLRKRTKNKNTSPLPTPPIEK
jgi:hypothetical protein